MKQGRMILWRLVLAAVTVTLCYGQVNETERTCERSTLHLNCNNRKVIHIHDALYGRTSDKFCGNTEPPAGGCKAEHSLSNVTEMCENLTSCSVKASNDVFGDPCKGIFKYLEVTYSCVRICGLNDECDNTTEVCMSDGGVDVLCNCGEDYEKVEGVCAIPVPCPEDVVEIRGIMLTFPRGETGESMYSEELCPPVSAKPEEPLATRYCDDEWAEPVVTECYDDSALENQLEEIANTNVTEDNVEEVGELLLLASSQTDLITESGLENIITSLALIVEVGSPSTEVTDSVVGVVNNMMSINETLLGDSSDIDEVVPLLESQVRFVHDLNDNYTELVTNLGVSALQLPKTSLEDHFVFEDPFMDLHDDVMESRKSSITLPPSVLDIIDTVNPNLTSIPVSFITYRDAVLFQSDLEVSSVNQEGSSVLDEYVDGHVISATIEIENVTIVNLPKNSSVITRFSKPMVDDEGSNETDVTIEFVCVFWDYNPNNGEGSKWSEEGCRMVSINDTEIVCACNHLTSFAVLVRFSSDIEESPYHVVLSVITIVGCVISIIGLSFTLVVMLLIRSVRIKQQTHVHFNLCLALLGLYLSFLLGVDRTDIPGVCKAMTSLIYFFCLSSVAWMSVEAFYIYMLIWKYKRSSIQHLVTVAVLLAWGLPAVGAIVIIFFDHGHNYDESPDYCFLHAGPVLYFGFLLEIFLLSFYNFAVFVLATYRVSCRKIRLTSKTEQRAEFITRLKSTFLFWVLLGLAWTFGFLATFQNPVSLVFQLLFCVCLSLQGFCMFYILIAQNPEMKKAFQFDPTKRSAGTSSTPIVGGTKSTYMKKDTGQSVDMQNNPTYISSSNEYEDIIID